MPSLYNRVNIFRNFLLLSGTDPGSIKTIRMTGRYDQSFHALMRYYCTNQGSLEFVVFRDHNLLTTVF